MKESVMLKVNNMDLEKVALFVSVNLVVPKIDCPYTAARCFYSFFFLIDNTGITQVASSLLCPQP